ncbi:MAG: hypothetical protein ACRENG_05640, partial [bacterium]
FNSSNDFFTRPSNTLSCAKIEDGTTVAEKKKIAIRKKIKPSLGRGFVMVRWRVFLLCLAIMTIYIFGLIFLQ